MNRKIASFNDDVDGMLLKPVAQGYKKVTPAIVRTGVSNFFNNIADVGSFFNNVFQLKVANSAEMLMRVGVNTLVGLGGVLDIASELNVERHPEDFGQTLGTWGVPPGPFLVLPLMGPSSLRDTAALVVDYQGDVTGYVDPVGSRTAMGILRTVNTRANLLKLGSMLDEAALDKYTFMRDAYLQRRRSQISDGADTE
jgi:phospholipid-binding lipoprotein MlaA